MSRIYSGVAVPLSMTNGVLEPQAANVVQRLLTDAVDVEVQACQISYGTLRMTVIYDASLASLLPSAIRGAINATPGISANGSVAMYNIAAPPPITSQIQTVSGGTSDVASVFGRVGAVVPQVGDYSFAHISGTLDGGTF